MNLAVDYWLHQIVEKEYLQDFVRQGGAAVKFLISPNAATRAEARDGLREAAERDGFQFAFVDAESVKVHLIDKLFHDVAGQVDWRWLCRSFIVRMLTENGFRVPEDGLSISSIAELNESDEVFVRSEVRRRVQRDIFRDYRMSQEFRFAMIRLCWAELDPGDAPALREAVEEWLRGELRLITTVKGALIFQRIARHNARHVLFSLAHWLKVAGRSGLVLVLDISRYADASRPIERTSGNYYTKVATLDVYEVLRQLIDATDELEYCFIGVLAGPEFLNDERRGVIGAYPALHMRISDEVRDKNRPNPLSSLVRLGASI